MDSFDRLTFVLCFLVTCFHIVVSNYAEGAEQLPIWIRSPLFLRVLTEHSKIIIRVPAFLACYERMLEQFIDIRSVAGLYLEALVEEVLEVGRDVIGIVRRTFNLHKLSYDVALSEPRRRTNSHLIYRRGETPNVDEPRHVVISDYFRCHPINGPLHGIVL